MSGSPSATRPSSLGSERARSAAIAAIPASAARDAIVIPSSWRGVLRRRRSSKSRWSTVSSTPSARSASACRRGNDAGTTASRSPSERAMRTVSVGEIS